jgi:hypothetical protein
MLMVQTASGDGFDEEDRMFAVEVWRIVNLGLASLAVVLFGLQTWRIRKRIGTRRQLLSIGLLTLLVRDVYGTLESMAQSLQFGYRIPLTTAAYAVVLFAVWYGNPEEDDDVPLLRRQKDSDH